MTETPEDSALPNALPEEENPIRQLVGKDFSMASAISPDKIEACQKLIDEARDGFFTTSMKDLLALESISHELKDEYDRFYQRLDNAQSIAYNIRGEAELHGFGFVAKVCAKLVKLLESQKLNAKKKSKVYSKLVGALRVAYDKKVMDDGESIGGQFLDDIKIDS